MKEEWWEKEEREIIERALPPLPFGLGFMKRAITKTFMRKGLITSCVVKHAIGWVGGPWLKMTTVSYGDRRGTQREVHYIGRHRFEGSALVIILPLEEEE